MSGSGAKPNVPLAVADIGGSLVACLTAVGWSPKMLARKINKAFGAGTVAESAPYYWVKSGGVPRPPVPTQVAHVLSQALGRTITVAELWQGRVADTGLLVPADAGLGAPWSHASGMALIEDWLRAGLLDRRSLLAVSGAPLVAIAQAHSAEPSRMAAALGGDHVDETLRAQVASLVPTLRAMDDRLGGGTATMGYVSAQFLAVASLLHHGRTTVTSSATLLSLLAELGQLAGWVSEDGGRHGVAQRYYFTARYAAHLSGDTPLAAHVTGLMSYQAACRGHIGDAIGLAQVALQLAASAPAIVRAAVAERAAHAYAVDGDAHRFDQTRDLAYDAFASHDDGDPRPPWTYYLDHAHLDSQIGLSEVAMGLVVRRRSRSTGQRLLEHGMVFLADAAGVDPHHPDQRRALFEGAWLAVAHAAVGDTRSAGSVANQALDRLGRVQSARSLAVLGLLRRHLSPYESNPDVAPLIRRLTAARAPDRT